MASTGVFPFMRLPEEESPAEATPIPLPQEVPPGVPVTGPTPALRVPLGVPTVRQTEPLSKDLLDLSIAQDRPWFEQRIPPRERSLVGEAVAGGLRGALPGTLESIGQAAEFVGVPSVGQPLQQASKRLMEAYPNVFEPSTAGAGIVGSAFESVARSIGVSIPALAAAAATSAATGGGMLPVIGAYILGSPLVLSAASGQQMYDATKRAGAPEDVAREAGRRAAAAEFVPELAGNILETLLLSKGLATPVVRQIMRRTIRNLGTDPSIQALVKPTVRETLSKLAATGAVEGGTEVTTEFLQSKIARDAGLDTEPQPFEAGAAGTLAGVIFGLMGLPLARAARTADLRTLSQPDADPARRQEIAQHLAQQMERSPNPELGASFLQYASTAIAQRQPIPLDQSVRTLLSGAQPAPGPEAEAAPIPGVPQPPPTTETEPPTEAEAPPVSVTSTFGTAPVPDETTEPERPVRVQTTTSEMAAEEARTRGSRLIAAPSGELGELRYTPAGTVEFVAATRVPFPDEAVLTADEAEFQALVRPEGIDPARVHALRQEFLGREAPDILPDVPAYTVELAPDRPLQEGEGVSDIPLEQRLREAEDTALDFIAAQIDQGFQDFQFDQAVQALADAHVIGLEDARRILNAALSAAQPQDTPIGRPQPQQRPSSAIRTAAQPAPPRPPLGVPQRPATPMTTQTGSVRQAAQTASVAPAVPQRPAPVSAAAVSGTAPAPGPPTMASSPTPVIPPEPPPTREVPALRPEAPVEEAPERLVPGVPIRPPRPTPTLRPEEAPTPPVETFVAGGPLQPMRPLRPDVLPEVPPEPFIPGVPVRPPRPQPTLRPEVAPMLPEERFAPTAPVTVPPPAAPIPPEAPLALPADDAANIQASQRLAAWVQQRLNEPGTITNQELFAAADRFFGGTQAQGTYTPKDAYDAMELGINQSIIENPRAAPRAIDARPVLGHLSVILQKLPTQTRRTGEQDVFQQFSTPPTLAYVAAWLANLQRTDTVLEPSAGLGGLAVFAKNAGATTIVNELSPRRAALLRTMGFDQVFVEDAEQIHNILPPEIQPTVVLMNPPFSTAGQRLPGLRKTRLATAHLEQALLRLQPNGRLVAIVGRGMAEDRPTFKSWWRGIKARYNVRANIGLPGEAYQKYGTTFDNQLIIIDKTGPTPEGGTLTGRVDHLADVLSRLEAIHGDRVTTGTRPSEQPAGEPARPTVAAPGPGGPRPLVGVPAPAPPVGPGVGGGAVAGQPAVTATEQPGGAAGPAPAAGAPLPAGGEPAGGLGEPRGSISPTGPTEPVGAAVPSPGAETLPSEPSLTIDTQAVPEAAGELSTSVYEPYQPQKLRIPGAKPHPGKLVQTAAMASVEPPNPTYTPTLPPSILDRLSIAQLEAVTYAGQAHQQMLPDGSRRGAFLGDGPGVGKGREIAGIILDNINQGRTKAVWISLNSKLFRDAQRDFGDTGGDVKQVFDLGKTQAAADIKAPRGVLFTTYATLKSRAKQTRDAQGNVVPGRTRLDQIVQWLGDDFEGVIAFDESHAMGNALQQKGTRGLQQASAQALAGLDLQRRLPNARVVYVSATGATEVSNLAYAERLGLWGQGTAFANVQAFVSQIAAGGLAAMELVARDLKARGLYLARNLSFEDVTYETLEHPLTPEQRDIYNTLAEGWQTVLQHVDAALEITGATQNAMAKSAARSAFWSAHQRFFNQIITAMQMPSVVQRIRQEISRGEAVVLQLVNTNEAIQERRLAEMEEEWTSEALEGLDLTPRENLMQYIQNSFPVQQFEEYTDDSGNIRTRPVTDASGNPVQNAEAVAAREALLDRLGSIRVPEGPLEILLNTFGPEQVAEVTGRSRRVVRVRSAEGERTEIQRRGEPAALADTRAFMDDRKPILVFSDAGGTGVSYHAALTSANQRHRQHFLVQAGWRADRAVQGMGRTHRTNEASAPNYVLVTTDLKGQKRFLSSIARRLDQLGALTKGQRQAGSQGLFSARDNLESQYAQDAMRQFWIELFNGQIPDLDFAAVTAQMGLDLIDETSGNLKANLTPVTQFLNRILSLPIDLQNQVFDAFFARVEQQVARAIAQGTLDVGVETVQALKTDVVSEQTVYTDPESGAETKYVHLSLTHPTKITPFTEARPARGFRGFYLNERSGKVWAVSEAGTRTLESGEVVPRYHSRGPTSTQIISDEDLQHLTPLTATDAQRRWDAAVTATPPTYTEDLHILTGTILPIWNRVPGKARVVRLQSQDGRRFLGRLIPDKELTATLENLGATASAPRISPQEAVTQILEDGATVRLANGWRLKRVRVSGEPRIEILGPDYADLQNLTREGAFTERIQWTTRVFIPTGERTTEVFAAVTQSRPVVAVERAVRSAEDVLAAAQGTAATTSQARATAPPTSPPATPEITVPTDLTDLSQVERVPGQGYYVNLRGRAERVAKAQPISVSGFEVFDLFLHRLPREKDWRVSEGITGYLIARGATPAAARAAAQDAMEQAGLERVRDMILRSAQQGLTPRYRLRAPEAPAQQLSVTPGQAGPLTLADVQAAFPGQTVTETDQGAWRVSLPSGYVDIVSVETIPLGAEELAAFEVGYGRAWDDTRRITGRFIPGVPQPTDPQASVARIELVRGAADRVTLRHEVQHVLEHSGLLTPQEIQTLEQAMQRQTRYQKRGTEDRAQWVAEQLNQRGYRRDTAWGRVLDKLWDFFDRLLSLVGLQTTRGVLRRIETGAVFDRAPAPSPGAAARQAFATAPQQPPRPQAQEPLAVEKKAFVEYLNFLNLATPALLDSIQRTQATFEKFHIPDDQLLRDAYATFERYNQQEGAWTRVMHKVQRGDLSNSVELNALRFKARREFHLLTAMLEQGVVDREQFDRLKDALMGPGSIYHTVNAVYSDYGRGLRTAQLMPEASREQDLLARLAEIEQTRTMSPDEWLDWVRRFRQVQATGDDAATKRFLDRVQDPTLANYLWEYWYGSVLLSFPTQVANAGGNTLWGLFNQGILRPLEAVGEHLFVAKLQGRQPERFVSEVWPALAGYVRSPVRSPTGERRQPLQFIRRIITAGPDVISGFPEMSKFQRDIGQHADAWANARWRLDFPVLRRFGLDPEVVRRRLAPYGIQPGQPIQFMRTVAPWVTLATRVMVAMDFLAKQAAYDSEITALATRRAEQERRAGTLSGSFDERVQTLIAQPPDDLHQAALEHSRVLTFMDEVSPVARLILRGRQIPVLGHGIQMLIPFAATPDRLITRALELVPGLGLWPLLTRTEQITTTAAGAQLFAKQMAGMILGVMAYALYQAGRLTGEPPEDDAEREAFYRQGKQAFAVKIGPDTWLSYRRFEPLNLAFGMLPVVFEAASRLRQQGQEVDFFAILGYAGFAMVHHIIDGSYFAGLQPLFKDRVSGAQAESFVGRLVDSWVPYSGLRRNLERAVDAYVTEEGSVLRNPDGFFQHLTGIRLGLDVRPRYNAWGQPVVIPGTVAAQFVPYRFSTASRDRVEQELARFEIYPGPLPRRKPDGTRYSPDEYDRLTILTGRAAKRRLDQLVASPTYGLMPEAARKRALKRALRQGREQGRMEYDLGFPPWIPGMPRGFPNRVGGVRG